MNETAVDWLPAKLVARMRQRRGRTHAFPTLDGARTALVVIDLVRLFTADAPQADAVIPQVNRLAKAVRGAAGLVAWVRPGSDPHPDLARAILGAEPAARYEAAAQPGDPRGVLDPRLHVLPADLQVSKRGYSAFFPGMCDLADALHARAVDTVLIAGALSHVCCEASARDAYACGFRTVMLADANLGEDAGHRAALATIYRNFGDVRTAAESLAMLAGAALP